MAALISRFVDESARRRWKDMVLALAPACRDSWSWTADEQILVWHFSIFQKSRSSLQTRLQHVLFFYPYCCLCFLFTAGCVRLCKKNSGAQNSTSLETCAVLNPEGNAWEQTWRAFLRETAFGTKKFFPYES